MHKNYSVEGSKLPQMQSEITCGNNYTSEYIKVLECFPIEPELSLFKHCFDLFGYACPICNKRFHNAS
jgi:hypothetical protein